MSTSSFVEAWIPGGDDSLRFYTRTYAAAGRERPRALLLFLHGFAEHVGRYEWAHGLLAKRCFTVFAYDQRGFGRTGAAAAAAGTTARAVGRTSWRALLADAGWWVVYLAEAYPALPVFAMEHSMSGALLLTIVSSATLPASAARAVPMLRGVIASSALVVNSMPISRALRYAARKASTVVPNLLVNATLPNEYMSHDPAVEVALDEDPLVKQKAGVKLVTDMLDAGAELLQPEHASLPHDTACSGVDHPRKR